MSTGRWKVMDVAFGDNLLRPRRLILTVDQSTMVYRYETLSESDGVGSLSENALRTKEEWLEWIDRFADDLTGRQLREAKAAVMSEFVEPESWRRCRERYAATGDPFEPW